MADYSDDKELIKEGIKALKEDMDDNFIERAKMLDDIKFCTLDQWPSEIRKSREDPNQEGGARPCLTIDKINQYIVQVVNDMRQGKPGINIRPQDDRADVETAKILKGLIRNIEDQSKADIAYATGGENAAKIGLGYWRVTTDYVSEDSFDQEIFIKPIPNTFSTYLGPHFMPDGSDSKRAEIIETIPLERFKAEYPKAKYKASDFEGLGEFLSDWHTGETVTVMEYYCLKRKDTTFHYLADGTTITNEEYDKWPPEAGVKPSIQNTRSGFREQLMWVKMTGIEVLEKRELPGKYIPIIECIGRESNIEGKRYLWGLVRPAKDTLRMDNYFASAITEKVGLAPMTPFVAAEGQIAGREQEWKTSNKIPRAVLQYKPIDVQGNVVAAPKRQDSMPMETALVNYRQMIKEDVRESLGIFKAGLGEAESQQSGRAILALQRETDTGTYHFGANQGISIRHTGVIILDLIPHYYDTKRIVRILGEDGEVKTVHLDPDQQESYKKMETAEGMKQIFNPSVGKYDVSISVGPSYNTKRQEAAATFVEMSKGSADPASAAVLRYLVMRNSDAAGSDEAAKLLKTLLPPQALQALSSNQPIPPEVQAQMQQMMQKMQLMQEEGQKLQQENVKLKSGEQSKMAAVSVDAEAKKKAHELAVAEAQDSAEREKEKARLDAATKITVAQINAKASLTETLIQAENEANKELIEALKEEGSEEPVSPIVKLTKMHQQGMEQHQQGMGQLGVIIQTLDKSLQQLVSLQQQTLQAILAPKSVSIGNVQKDSQGNITGASIKSSPNLRAVR